MAHVEPIRGFLRTIDPPGNVAALRRAVAAQSGAAMLESLQDGRYSIYAWEPVTRQTVSTRSAVDPFTVMAHAARPWRSVNHDSDLPFFGGWMGFLTYEAGRFVEPSAGWKKNDDRLPLSSWGLYDTILIHDRRDDDWHVTGIDLPMPWTDGGRPDFEERADAMERRVHAWNREVCAVEPPACGPGRWNFARTDYFAKANKALEYIRAGDIFQVNLARRFRASVKDPAPALYVRLCEKNPAPYAAFLDAPGGQVLSSSPELFLELREREIVTRPIKGTRPRSDSAIADEQAKRELAASVKDQAELNMIVDLERNDLGRVCEYGSVRVVDDGRIEAHPTVFHRTATITGRLRDDADAIDLLRAAFPGGSVTGAPKVRAMQIINELEPDPRGAYCGAIGCIGLNGDLQLNLAIRTMTVADGIVDFQVGSAIVADSDPEAEYRELGAKAAGMLAALGQQEDVQTSRAPVRRQEPVLQ